MRADRSRTGAGRRTAFVLSTLVLVYCVVEAAAWIAYAVVGEASFSLAGLQAERARVIEALGSPAAASESTRSRPLYLQNQVVHPFVGFVQDPSKRGDVNAYGFLGPAPPLRGGNDDPDTLSVAIVGGSVALDLVLQTSPELQRKLQEGALSHGRQVRLYNLALPGMKQPQQLMAVSYFLALGAHFDVVINLDGFNDIVLPITQNAKQGTSLFYPRAWRRRVEGLADSDLLYEAGRVAFFQGVRAGMARAFAGVPLRYSVAANVVWSRLDLFFVRTLEWTRVQGTETLLNRPRSRRKAGYQQTGPVHSYDSDEVRFAELAAFWKRSSITLHELAQGGSFDYFHFLQPNQYVKDSKIFSEEERAIALPKQHPHREAATAGYPYLIKAGRELVREGVAFKDLTMIFAGTDEVVYVDGCCHFNERGNSLIAREIARLANEHASRP